MSVRIWSVKVGELRALDSGLLLVFGARCGLRVSPWLPKTATAHWKTALDIVLASAAGEVANAARVRQVARALSDSGSIACNKLDGTPDEARGRCMSYATSSLVEVLEATRIPELGLRKKALLDSAKLSASIPAVLAHAGLIAATPGGDAVTQAATAIWDAIRADLPVIAGLAPGRRLNPAKLKSLGPLWPGGQPSWVPARQR